MNLRALTACLLAACTSTQRLRAQTVAVHVKVRTEAGLPIENAPVAANIQSKMAFGLTDAAGMVTLEPAVGDEPEEVFAGLNDGALFDLDGPTEALATLRYEELRDSYYFQRYNSVPYEEGMTAADLEIVAYDSITVTGNVISPAPTWASDRVAISVRGGLWFGDFGPTEAFEVRGVRKAQAAELFFILHEERAVRSVKLTAAQTQDDVALGDVQFPAIGSGAVVDIAVSHQQDLWEPGGGFPMWMDVTLISFDGETILCYPINRANGKVVRLMATVQPKQPPSIPPGRYYVCPGLFGNRTQLYLLDMIRDRQHPLLAASGVPMINAADGVTTALALDAAAARDAVLAAHGQWTPE